MSDTYYKLTDERDRSFCDFHFQWGPHVTCETNGMGPLGASGWTHWYTHPLLAVLLNPIYGIMDQRTVHLWKGRCKGNVWRHYGLIVGCTRGTTLRRIEVPVLTQQNRVRFAIGCAWQVWPDGRWRRWAARWLSGKDRSKPLVRLWKPIVWGRAAIDPAQVAAGWAMAAAATTTKSELGGSLWRQSANAARAAWFAAERAAVDETLIDLIALAEWAVTDSTEVPHARN